MSQSDTALRAIVAPGIWEIDRDHSNIEFVARHLLSRVRGRFTEFAGLINVDADPARSFVEVAIQAASIKSNHDERDAHLRNSDFLDVSDSRCCRFTAPRSIRRTPTVASVCWATSPFGT